jgi:lipopolysaccharide/colanic/teichoic acid biosynthesis glycosyltransferase
VVGASLSDRSVAAIAVDGQAYPVVGSIHDAAATAHRLGADAIIVASQPDDDPDFVQRLSQQMVGTAAELVIGGRLADVAGPRISLRPLEGLPLIQVKIPTFEGGAHVVKRAFDLVVSSLALLLIAPVSLVMALAIKISDGGPVFYRQKRVGRDGREFDMLKFRSMRVGADAERALLQAQNDGSGPLFKMRDDPRVTRLGRALRKHSLDELPQFWNVFIGDMSVVGPRPPLPSEVTTYDGRVYRRLYIKPGSPARGRWAAAATCRGTRACASTSTTSRTGPCSTTCGSCGGPSASCSSPRERTDRWCSRTGPRGPAPRDRRPTPTRRRRCPWR